MHADRQWIPSDARLPSRFRCARSEWPICHTGRLTLFKGSQILDTVLQTTFQQLITSLLQVGLIVASVAIGPMSNVFGRRAGYMVASGIGFVGVTIQVLVNTAKPLYLGRLLLGM